MLIGFLLNLFGLAGGGGSSSGGGGFSGGGSSDDSSGLSLIGSLISFGVMLLIFLIIFLCDRYRVKKQAIKNSTPENQQIITEAKQIFFDYQDAWSHSDLSSLQSVMSPEYFKHANLMIECLKGMNRENRVENIQLNEVNVISELNANENIEVQFNFHVNDTLYDISTNERFFSNELSGSETWVFKKIDDRLILDHIIQPTESAEHLVNSIKQFAHEANMFYSADWGRLALPTAGQIFNPEVLRSADVNNHTIGKWNNILVQIYTYKYNPEKMGKYYVIGQLTLPKSYRGILVTPKTGIVKSKDQKPPQDYTQYKLEWEDFNRRYNLYAAPGEAVPAFELLDPTFMELLHDKNPKCCLEVKDNQVIFYTPLKNNLKINDYYTLLEILTAAHKRLER